MCSKGSMHHRTLLTAVMITNGIVSNKGRVEWSSTGSWMRAKGCLCGWRKLYEEMRQQYLTEHCLFSLCSSYSMSTSSALTANVASKKLRKLQWHHSRTQRLPCLDLPQSETAGGSRAVLFAGPGYQNSSLCRNMSLFGLFDTVSVTLCYFWSLYIGVIYKTRQEVY